MVSNFMTRRVGLVLAAAILGCSSGGDAKLTVRLVDGPTPDLEEVNVHVLRVLISADGTEWRTLGTPDRVVNLLALTGGVEETLVDGASLPAGTYGQMRLVLGPGNTVKVGGVVHDLTVPSGMQSGVKLPVSFTVAPNTTKDVFIDFDAHRSVFVHSAGASQKYILRPVVRAYDEVVTGAVAGKLVDGAGAPLGLVDVTAQTLDGGGAPTIVRTTTTAADGTYVLALLPVGGSYWVVAQPRTDATTYAANAAGPFDVTTAAPVASAPDLAFAQAAGVGGVGGKITPAATEDQGDVVSATAPITVGATPHTFVIRTAAGEVSSGNETYEIDRLPAGGYSVSATRGTLASGTVTYVTGAAVPATVTDGQVATANLTVP